jgi:2-methylcitrate dehydratase PrpD
VDASTVTAIRVRTPFNTLQPLNRHSPTTGLEGKFSLEYGIATALLDSHVGFAAFTDTNVNRAEAQRLVSLVRVEEVAGASAEGLLDGEFEVVIKAGGKTHRGTLRLPPGAPGRPPSDEDLAAKVADCCGPRAGSVMGLDWVRAAPLLREALD